ncbi:MAG: Gfo/Idh/MocA family oxidoreductase [Clostridiales bacterium]|nr:Gfo/Idh/MocA family oxidoreductase [Clostridiales bacterium]
MKVKWGVLGTAAIAEHCTIPGMKLAENCELYAIAGRSEEKVRKFKEQFGFEVGYVGYEKLLSDPSVEAVYIPLPNHIHKEWVIKALRAGKHVLCEKPLALNASEAQEMFDEATRNHVILMEAYAYLHGQYVESLCKDVASGVIGDLVYIDTAFLTQGYKEDFRLYKDLGGGMIYDLGCYCTTMILSLLAASSQNPEPVYVRAVAEMSDEAAELGSGDLAKNKENRVDAFAGVLMKFQGGVRASFDCGMVLGVNGFGRYDRLYIHGTKGAIRSEVEYNQEGELSYQIHTADEVIERKVTVDQNYKLEVEQLGRCIRDGEAPHITADFSIRNAKLLDAILKEAGY